MDAHGCASSASGPHTQITHDAVAPPLRRYQQPRYVLNTSAFILFVPLTITHYSASTHDAPSGRTSGAFGVPTSEHLRAERMLGETYPGQSADMHKPFPRREEEVQLRQGVICAVLL